LHIFSRRRRIGASAVHSLVSFSFTTRDELSHSDKSEAENDRSPRPQQSRTDILSLIFDLHQDVSSCGDATEDSAKYLDELVKDMRELNALPGAYPHALRLLNEEIDRVWCVLYPGGVATGSGPAPSSTVPPQSAPLPPLIPPQSTVPASLISPSALRDTYTPTSPRTISAHENILAIQRAYAALVGSHFDPFEGGVTVQEKIPIPYYPRCNFIGRILGPRGISVKQIESETECNILVRGRGSVKDPVREARLLNHPGWEHLTEPLHVLIKATDVSQALAEVKLHRGVSAVSKLLTPSNDAHKRRQLVQLAIINGTYRCNNEA
ncbi:hypothetical protein PRIPAC_73051, partial [Pristionchus pacificus]|uniref:KH domain-containing protein n=1 Tax=Pristionchus pacificus TaxID=54126 RepID=A0A2A6BZK1_PRIPA